MPVRKDMISQDIQQYPLWFHVNDIMVKVNSPTEQDTRVVEFKSRSTKPYGYLP